MHWLVGGEFHCQADADADCRVWPDCECERWEDGHSDRPGHEPVPQAHCWMQPWLEATDPADTWDHDAHDHAEASRGMTWPTGAIMTSWEGDYVVWYYVDPELVPVDA